MRSLHYLKEAIMMYFRTPNKGQVAKVFNSVEKTMKYQIQEEHQNSWSRFQGFFRQHLKIMLPYHLTTLSSTALKTTYSGVKSGVQFILKQTVGNLPFGGTVTTVINSIYSIAETGVSFGAGIAKTKLVKKLAERGLSEREQGLTSQYWMHKYTAEQGVENIKRCVAKVKYAGQLLSKESAQIIYCRQFFKAMHDLKWFEYRVNRLRGEIAVMQTYLDIMEETADKAADSVQIERDYLLAIAETLLMDRGWNDDAWHKDCGAMCLRDQVRYQCFSELYMPYPQKAVPPKPLPVPPPTRRFPSLPPRPHKKLPSLPPR
jgi:hypothetical protein